MIIIYEAGDISKCYSDSRYAKEILGWESKKTIEDMAKDSLKWQSNNPNGYKKVKERS